MSAAASFVLWVILCQANIANEISSLVLVLKEVLCCIWLIVPALSRTLLILAYSPNGLTVLKWGAMSSFVLVGRITYANGSLLGISDRWR